MRTEKQIINDIIELQNRQRKIAIEMINGYEKIRKSQIRKLSYDEIDGLVDKIEGLGDEIKGLLDELERINPEKAFKMLNTDITDTLKNVDYLFINPLKNIKADIDEIRSSLKKLDPKEDEIMYKKGTEMIQSECKDLQHNIGFLKVFGESFETVAEQILNMSWKDIVRSYNISNGKKKTWKEGIKVAPKMVTSNKTEPPSSTGETSIPSQKEGWQHE